MEIEPPDQEQPKPLPSETPKGKFLQNAFIRVQDFLFDPANFKKLIIGVVVLISIFVVRRIFFPPSPDLSKTKSAEESEKSDLVPVKVFKVGRFNFEDSLNALGTIKGLVEFKLSFEIPGVVSAINYREGEYYEEGALLISLKQDDILLRLQRSQAQDQKALAALKITQDKLEEHQKLFKMGAIPKSTLDRAALEMDQARFEHESAELETKANESILEKSNLYAPTAGTIGELNIEEGEAVTQNTLVGSHVRTDRVLATFGITERDINKVSLGQKANVFVDAYPERTFEGIVENVAPVIIGTSRTADVRVRIENPEGILLPGMFARIKILLYQKRNTLVVPTDALLGKENEQHVFVVDPEEKGVTQTPVVVGYSRVDYVQIDSGINEGDLVVVSGMDRLKEDSKVRILETQEAEL